MLLVEPTQAGGLHWELVRILVTNQEEDRNPRDGLDPEEERNLDPAKNTHLEYTNQDQTLNTNLTGGGPQEEVPRQGPWASPKGPPGNNHNTTG